MPEISVKGASGKVEDRPLLLAIELLKGNADLLVERKDGSEVGKFVVEVAEVFKGYLTQKP